MDAKKQVASVAIAANGALMLLKVAVGLFTGSVAMISDGIHSATDLMAAFVAWLSIKVAGRPADPCHPYGHGKFENLAALSQGVLVLVATLAIGQQALKRLQNPLALTETGWGMAVMLVSIIAHSLVCTRMLKVARQYESPALAGASLHMLTDIASSLAVLVGLILAAVVGWQQADAVAALLVSGVLLWGVAKLLINASKDLVDSSLTHREYGFVEQIFRDHIPPLKSFHNLRSRRVGEIRYVDAHLVVDGALSVEQAHELCDHLEDHIRSRLPKSCTLLHVEPQWDQEDYYC